MRGREDSFLDSLPDLFAEAEERGQPIVFRPSGPPAEHVVRLMATLGVPIELPEVGVTPQSGGITMGVLKEREQAMLDAKPMTSSCGVPGCDWTFTGPALQAREAFAAHRESTHPEIAKFERRIARPADQKKNGLAQAAGVAAMHESREAARDGSRGRNDDGTTWSRKGITRDQAISRMRETISGLDAIPTRNGWAKAKLKPAVNALERIFGSYEKAIRATGAEPPAPREPFPLDRVRIIEAIQQHARVHGRPPTSKGWKRIEPGRPTQDQVLKVFGSWNTALEEAGCETRRPVAETHRASVRVPQAPETNASSSREIIDAPASEPPVTTESPRPAPPIAEPGTRTEVHEAIAAITSDRQEALSEPEQPPRDLPAAAADHDSKDSGSPSVSLLVALARIEGRTGRQTSDPYATLATIHKIAREALGL